MNNTILSDLAKHIREEAEYRIREKQSPTMTILIPVDKAEEIATALETASKPPWPTERMKFLAKWLYHGSEDSNKLNRHQHLTAFALGDGYGNMTIEQLIANGLTWDWSHIRDSSDSAKMAIETYLRSIGCD